MTAKRPTGVVAPGRPMLTRTTASTRRPRRTTSRRAERSTTTLTRVGTVTTPPAVRSIHPSRPLPSSGSVTPSQRPSRRTTPSERGEPNSVRVPTTCGDGAAGSAVHCDALGGHARDERRPARGAARDGSHVRQRVRARD